MSKQVVRGRKMLLVSISFFARDINKQLKKKGLAQISSTSSIGEFAEEFFGLHGMEKFRCHPLGESPRGIFFNMF